MFRVLILFALVASILLPSASAQTPEAEPQFTYVSGTALDLVPEGKPGIIDIVPFVTGDIVETDGPSAFVFSFGTSGVPVVVWNNTSAPVRGMHVFGMVRSATGTLRAAITVPVFPYSILPGEFSFTVVTIGGQLPDGPNRTDVVTFEAFFPSPSSNQGQQAPPETQTVALEVVEPEVHGNDLTGTVRGLPPLPQIITTVALCFDASGRVRGTVFDFDAVDGAENAPRSYWFELDLEVPCDRFLVAAQTEYSAETTVG